MKNKAEAMVLASFAADSLALGAHWIYDQKLIADQFGRVDHYLRPGAGSYHPTKGPGQFTHYGDQAFILLESLAACNGFDLEDFSRRWQLFFKDYTGYYDKATRDTLANFARGLGPVSSGSASHDLAGATRIAPLVFFLREEPERLVAAARAQTAMTHNHDLTLDAAELLARSTVKILQGSTPTAAIADTTEERFLASPLAGLVREGLAARSEESIQSALRFGQSCRTAEAFPTLVQITARYEWDLKGALIQNVMAGGDSAARGLAVGMLLGAHLGYEGIPKDWIEGMELSGRIVSLLGGSSRANP